MKHILVIAHDSGGAEVVSAWVRKHPEFRFEFLLEGPALNIFQRKLGSLPVLGKDQLDAAIARAQLVLCGSSWSSDLEKTAVRQARKKAVRTAVYLDHWVDYAERFELAGTTCLPDELWVGDTHAQTLALKHFPAHLIQLEPNLYFEEMRAEIDAAAVQEDRRGSPGLRVLYLSEPVSEYVAAGGPDCYGSTEFQALTKFLEYLKSHNLKIERLRVRHHPSEKPGKYAELLERFASDFEIEYSTTTTLPADCAWADWIVGLASMALAIAVFARKRVSTCIAPVGLPLVPPYPEIEHLFSGKES